MLFLCTQIHLIKQYQQQQQKNESFISNIFKQINQKIKFFILVLLSL